MFHRQKESDAVTINEASLICEETASDEVGLPMMLETDRSAVKVSMIKRNNEIIY